MSVCVAFVFWSDIFLCSVLKKWGRWYKGWFDQFESIIGLSVIVLHFEAHFGTWCMLFDCLFHVQESLSYYHECISFVLVQFIISLVCIIILNVKLIVSSNFRLLLIYEAVFELIKLLETLLTNCIDYFPSILYESSHGIGLFILGLTELLSSHTLFAKDCW